MRDTRAQPAGGEGRSPLPFLKIEKSVLILEKNVLIVFIPGLHFSFNIKFSEHLVEKTTKFLSFGSFSYVAVETFT